jgi:hypothetical protein
MKKVLTTIGLILTILLLIILMIACQGGIIGNGKVVTRTEDVGKFTRLVIGGNFNVFLTQSDNPSLKLEMDENLMDIVRITEEGNTLRIDTKINILQARQKNLYITVKDLEKLDLTGAVKLTNDSVLQLHSLNILAAGAVRLDMSVETRQLKLDLAGASECNIRGKADELRMQLSGAGDFDAYDLIASDVEIDMSGAGSARVYATEQLDVSISGAGSVRYRGDPDVHKRISGIGSLKRDY